MTRTLCKVQKGPPHPAMPGSDLCSRHSGSRPRKPRTVMDALRELLAEAEERDDPREAGLVAGLRGALEALTGDTA